MRSIECLLLRRFGLGDGMSKMRGLGCMRCVRNPQPSVACSPNVIFLLHSSQRHMPLGRSIQDTSVENMSLQDIPTLLQDTSSKMPPYY